MDSDLDERAPMHTSSGDLEWHLPPQFYFHPLFFPEELSQVENNIYFHKAPEVWLPHLRWREQPFWSTLKTASLLQWIRNCRTGQPDRAVCPSSPKSVPPVFVSSGFQSNPLYTSLSIKMWPAQALGFFPVGMAEPRVQDEGGCQTRGARVARDATLSHACQILCPIVVSTIKVCNPTFQFFIFPLCSESDTTNNKVTRCLASLGWIVHKNCSLLVRFNKVNELKGSICEKTNQKPFPSFLYKTCLKEYTCKLIPVYFYCTCERKGL